MKLTQRFYKIPGRWDEPVTPASKEITINENISFSEAINAIELYCKDLEYFHHYTIETKKRTLKLSNRMVFYVYQQDPSIKLKGNHNVVIHGHENEVPPTIICIFNLYNDDSHPFYCRLNEFNVSNIS